MHSKPPPGRSWLADQPLQRKIMFAVGLLLGLFLLSSAMTLRSLQQQEDSRFWTTHTYQVLFELDHLERALQASQIGARGYLLNQRADQRTLFEDSTRDVRSQLALLRRLMVDNALQLSRIDALDARINQWVREVSGAAIEPMAALDPADVATLAVARQRIQSGYLEHRTVHSEDLHAAIAQLVDEENRLLAARNGKLHKSLTISQLTNIVAAVLALLLGLAMIGLTARLVSRPLSQLTDLMTRLARHDHDFHIPQLRRRDEVGEIARALQVFRQMSMDTQAQTWIKSQVSGISHVLLQATTHKEFAQWLTSEVVPLFGAGLGLFYAFDDARGQLDLIGSYGLRLRGRPEHYLPGEGLVGQCVVERKAIMLDDVPEDYLRIDSGSGEALPRHVAILPVLYRDTLIGVLELASFNPLPPMHRQLLDELLPIVALALENLNRTLNAQDLVLQTREQADELRLSELVMRQQKEVLRENNDALQAKTSELEQQSARLTASEEELRRQADELQAFNEELKATSIELARASRYKSEFLANMSHELRTPLNSLLILSRSLADNDGGNLDAEQVESARIIHDAGTSLLHLINDILDLSKIEAGKMELVLDELPLARLGERLRRTFSHVATQKGLAFSLEIEPDLPATLRTDGARLEQVANNLLSNAFKFTAQGGVTLRIGRPGSDTAVPAALQGQRLLAMSVSDTGIGIPADKTERIFSAFEQVDASTSRQYGGTGLGLTISRRIALLLGGDIVLHSESGRGSCFTLLLPETPPALSPRASDTGKSTFLASPHLLPDEVTDDRHSLLSGQRVILLVEDDPPFARILIDRIHRKGCHALAAADGEAGLELARKYRPDGIVLDVALPTRDGWSVLEGLKADDTTRAIPVHCISVTDEAPRALASGAIGFLTKPVSREAIDHAIDRLLEATPERSEAAGGGSAPGLAGRRVLLVDDDMRNLFALSRVMRGWGMQVGLAQNGAKALAMLADEPAPELLLTDIMMPGMDGYELIRAIRREPRFGALPIIALTAKAMQGDREHCLAMGASDYLSKPIDIDQLAARMLHWLPS